MPVPVLVLPMVVATVLLVARSVLSTLTLCWQCRLWDPMVVATVLLLLMILVAQSLPVLVVIH